MTAIRLCPFCSSETNHAWRPGRGQYECLACHEFAWPAQAPVDDPDLAAGTAPTLIPVEDRAAQEAGTARMLGMWRAAVATVTEAARREAEQRENEAAWRLVERTCGWCLRSTCMAFNVGTPRFGTPAEKSAQAEAWRRECAEVCEENRRRRAEERTAAIDPGPAPMPVLKEDKC